MPDLGISAAIASGNPEQALIRINAGILEYAPAYPSGILPAEQESVISNLEEPYLQLLKSRNSHRVRGLITVIGYAMEGGEDDEVAVKLAIANEVNQVALVTADDVMDDAPLRRGTIPVHRLLAGLFDGNSTADEETAKKSGESLAIVGSMGWQYEAQEIICQLDVPAELRLSALSIINRNMRITGFGQALDIYHSKKPPATLADIRSIMLAKTAIYTVRNPLEVGMAVAGGSEANRRSTRGYSDAIGTAFQALNDLDVMDDLATRSSKDPTEDIRGGKQTLLTYFALSDPSSSATDSEKIFLEEALRGSRVSDEDFLECQRILKDSGAADYAKAEVRRYGRSALSLLEESAEHAEWNESAIQMLADITRGLITKA